MTSQVRRMQAYWMLVTPPFLEGDIEDLELNDSFVRIAVVDLQENNCLLSAYNSLISAHLYAYYANLGACPSAHFR